MRNMCAKSIYVCLCLLLSLMTVSCGDKNNKNVKDNLETNVPDSVIVEEPQPVEPLVLYGIEVDNYDMIDGVVKKNEVLSTILSKYNVSQSKIYNIAKESSNTLDVKRLRANSKYTVFVSKDSVPTAHYLKYDINKIDYVVYAFADSIYSYFGAKETDTIVKIVSGEITTCLWDALIDNGATPALADEMSDVFAWTVDFFGIQKGDTFETLYQQIFVDDTVPVGIGRILSSSLTNSGTTFNAYYYDNDKYRGYFNENGESMKKQFLKAPLKYKRISSGFTYKRMHPIYKVVRPHLGVDYAAAAGTPVYSVGDGVVIGKGYDKKGGGNFVKIKHNSTYTTLYMHLKGFAKGISVGTRVEQGQLIGYVGSTGASTGPHLDYRVFKNGTPINPLNMNPEPVEPIGEDAIEDFRKTVNYYELLISDL